MLSSGDVESCMKILLAHVETRDEAADILDTLKPIMLNDDGCSCCSGDEALFWKDDQNCAFVDSTGEIMVVVRDKAMRFKVDCCPKCGRKFRKG